MYIVYLKIANHVSIDVIFPLYFS